MTARIDPHWTYRGLPAVRIENRAMALEVLPDLGAKIFRLIDKPGDRNVLWENIRIPPHRAPVFATFDDHWSGGWDEAFPCGAPSIDRYGEPTPYMGELWSAANWEWRVIDAGDGSVGLECSVLTPLTPARYTRTLTIRGDEPVVESRIRVEHVGTRPFDMIMGTHPCLAISPHHRFDVPAIDAEVDEYGGEELLGVRGDTYRWPILTRRDGVEVDVRRVGGPEIRSVGLHYLTGLHAGWAACTDTSIGRGFGLVFDQSFFPVVWLWQVYGGWRGYYHAAMEAWTSWPGILADAVRLGRARTMEPGDVLETTLHGVRLRGRDGRRRAQRRRVCGGRTRRPGLTPRCGSRASTATCSSRPATTSMRPARRRTASSSRSTPTRASPASARPM